MVCWIAAEKTWKKGKLNRGRRRGTLTSETVLRRRPTANDQRQFLRLYRDQIRITSNAIPAGPALTGCRYSICVGHSENSVAYAGDGESPIIGDIRHTGNHDARPSLESGARNGSIGIGYVLPALASRYNEN